MDPTLATSERTLRLAHEFLQETRAQLERVAAEGADLPPRVRMIHDRSGHAGPEYRTLAVPIPEGAEGASPAVLSTTIANYVARRAPNCLLLTLDVIGSDEEGRPRQLLIAEARDRTGTRFFFVQPFEIENGQVSWHEPENGGWQDPGREEMILDAAFE